MIDTGKEVIRERMQRSRSACLRGTGMNRALILILSVTAQSWALAAGEQGCLMPPDDPERFGARVRIVEEGRGPVREWLYWRLPRRVAYEYPDRQWAELWYRLDGGQVSYQRRIDQHKRVINYSPATLRLLDDNQDWERQRQLVSLAGLTNQGSDLYRCQPVSRWQGELDGSPATVFWSDALGMALRIQRGTTELLVTEFAEALATTGFFQRDRNYVDLDFADIGDNESDPFIRTMIAQGFIEHRH